MLRKTGLLIVSNPTQIGKALSSAEKQVKNTLYIQLLSSLKGPRASGGWPKLSGTILSIYSQAATHCDNLDVRVLLSSLKHDMPNIRTDKPIDVIIFDRLQSEQDIEAFVTARIQNITREYEVVVLDNGEPEEDPSEAIDDENDATYNHVVLGGTFDRLHVAHKVLLSEAVLRSSEKVTVGVTDDNMTRSKVLSELIEKLDVRLRNVEAFLREVHPELRYDVVPISDPFGPAIEDPTMEAIVVSRETMRGAEKINEIRKQQGLNELAIVPLELVDEPNPSPIEEPKISSSTRRIRLLGTLLRPVEVNDRIPQKPYVIGLTGGIASGKSGVAKHLQNLGAVVINCDLIAHKVYEPGKPCYRALVDHFGERILTEEGGPIDRSILGGIVFQDKEQLQRLNEMVWPAIADEVRGIIARTDRDRVVVIEAAVLLTARWDSLCHEVWTTVVPREEALKRLTERNNLPEDKARQRIESQPSNSYYVERAHVVFSTLWEVEYTKGQVLRAWDSLKERLDGRS